MSEIRYDRVFDTHVIIAPERLHRPDSVTQFPALASVEECPFCEGNESMTPPEIFALRDAHSYPNEKGWKTRVVPNLYKALEIEAAHIHHTGTFDYWEGFGAHEVVIDTPAHHTSMTQWSEDEMAVWLKTVQERVKDLRRDSRIVSLCVFKNEGERAGSTQHHCHTQIIGLPFIPKNELGRYERECSHFYSTSEALLGKNVADEKEARVRMVMEQGEFSAYCPYASAYPFEVMISSVEPLGEIDELSIGAIDDLSILLVHVLQRLQRQLGTFHFNLTLSTPHLGGGECDLYHGSRFFIRISPRLYLHGGFELASGVIINPVAPEIAAKLLSEGYYV